MKTVWEIEWNKQVLYEGTWDSDDCVWDWETEREQFPSLTGARKIFKMLRATSDIPLIRLYECTYDKYGCKDDEQMLDEIDSYEGA